MNDSAIERIDWNDPVIEYLLTANDLPHSDLSPSIEFRCVRALPGGAVAGIAGFERHGTYALLRSVAVAAECRGKGYGALLVGEILRVCAAEGVSAVYALTTTAERYFLKHGFATISRESVPDEIRATSEFSDLCPISSACLEKTLR